MQLAGHYNRTTIGEIIELIRDAGFVPAQRTTLYEILREFPEGPAEEAAKSAVSGEW
jgi:2-iminoacetate synthase ThiH